MLRALVASSLFCFASVGCTSNQLDTGSTDLASVPDHGLPDLAKTSDLTSCHTEKFKFTGCDNDGSVELCAPTSLAPALTSMVPTLTCAPGGGRAKCNQPGLLLCTYPTAVPRECASTRGALTATATQELCTLAAHDEIVEIVPTIFI